MFLKLEGVWGESKNLRHLGEIEIFGFGWGNTTTPAQNGSGLSRSTLANNSGRDLTVFKKSDTLSPVLIQASTTGRNFAEAILTVEDLSDSGHLLRAVVLKMQSVYVTSTSSFRGEDTVALNYQSIQMNGNGG